MHADVGRVATNLLSRSAAERMLKHAEAQVLPGRPSGQALPLTKLAISIDLRTLPPVELRSRTDTLRC